MRAIFLTFFRWFKPNPTLRFRGNGSSKCRHIWIEKDFRRDCTKCGRHEMLYADKYPRTEWK